VVFEVNGSDHVLYEFQTESRISPYPDHILPNPGQWKLLVKMRYSYLNLLRVLIQNTTWRQWVPRFELIVPVDGAKKTYPFHAREKENTDFGATKIGQL